MAKKVNKVKDFENVARREKLFSTLAKKEGKGAHERYESEKKKGMKASAADSKREERIDNTFSRDRLAIATDAKRKASRAK